ncbi:MAG TPA: hypothetical protein VIW02_09180 [Gammaproteobacteria bacterium]
MSKDQPTADRRELNLGEIRREMRHGFDRVMAKLERDYNRGHEQSLLVAVEMCLMHASMWGTAPPQWVVDAYSYRLWRFMNSETGSLDEAFGVDKGRPPGEVD